jgi:hypothetical protein
MKKETQNSAKVVLHDKNGKFKKGHPKVGGAVIGSRSFTTKVRDALEKIAEGKDYTYEEAFIKSILKKAIVDGDASTQRLVWNYLDGMPKQSVDIEHNVKELLSDEQIDELLKYRSGKKNNDSGKGGTN